MRTTSANDVLRGASLELLLPTSALDIPEVTFLLGRLSKKRAKIPTLSSALAAPGITRVDLGRADWEWAESAEQAFDADGDSFDYTLREDLTLDDSAVSTLSNRQHQVSSALCALGIPHNTAFTDGQNPGKTLLCGRLEAGDPRAPCSVHGIDPDSVPDAKEILDQARSCETFEELKALRDWLAENSEIPGSLDADAAHFDRLVADPQWRTFVGASAGILSWAPQTVGFLTGAWELDWDSNAPTWAQAHWEGEDPFTRMERLGLGMNHPPRQFELATQVALSQEPPQIELAGRALSAFCAHVGHVKVRGKSRDVSWAAAHFVGAALASHPELAELFSERAYAFFELKLAAPGVGSTGADCALAEALWLGTQMTLARQVPLAPSRPRLSL